VILGAGGSRWRRWLSESDTDPEPGRVFVRQEKKWFKRLEVGDEVKAGEVVALVDPALALGDLRIKRAGLDSSESDLRASIKTKEEAERRVASMEESMRRVPGSVSKDDYEGAKLTARRYLEEEVAKASAVVKAQQELIQAMAVVDMHEMRTPVSGVIKSVERERGDVAKSLETVLTIEAAPAERRVERTGKVRAVRSVRDGVLAFIGTEIQKGERAAPELVVTVGTGANAKRYRRLQVGDTVEPGQLLALLDDRLARFDIVSKESQVRAGEADLRVATKTKEESDRRLQSMEESMRRVPGSVAKDDYESARLTSRLYHEQEISRGSNVTVREAELDHAKAVLATYEVRSYSRGVVRELLKVPGEAVRVGEPVLELIVTAP
jgi:multidrug efflux pump subunit AcrA (membrane-fusion protein)